MLLRCFFPGQQISQLANSQSSTSKVASQQTSKPAQQASKPGSQTSKPASQRASKPATTSKNSPTPINPFKTSRPFTCFCLLSPAFVCFCLHLIAFDCIYLHLLVFVCPCICLLSLAFASLCLLLLASSRFQPDLPEPLLNAWFYMDSCDLMPFCSQWLFLLTVSGFSLISQNPPTEYMSLLGFLWYYAIL